MSTRHAGALLFTILSVDVPLNLIDLRILRINCAQTLVFSSDARYNTSLQASDTFKTMVPE